MKRNLLAQVNKFRNWLTEVLICHAKLWWIRSFFALVLKTFKSVYCLSTVRVHSLRFYSLKKFALARKLVNDESKHSRWMKDSGEGRTLSHEAICDGSHSESKSRQRTLSCLSMEYFTGVSVCMVFFFLTSSWTTTNPPWDKIISKYLGAIVRKRWINNIIMCAKRRQGVWLLQSLSIFLLIMPSRHENYLVLPVMSSYTE